MDSAILWEWLLSVHRSALAWLLASVACVSLLTDISSSDGQRWLPERWLLLCGLISLILPYPMLDVLAGLAYAVAMHRIRSRFRAPLQLPGLYALPLALLLAREMGWWLGQPFADDLTLVTACIWLPLAPFHVDFKEPVAVKRFGNVWMVQWIRWLYGVLFLLLMDDSRASGGGMVLWVCFTLLLAGVISSVQVDFRRLNVCLLIFWGGCGHLGSMVYQGGLRTGYLGCLALTAWLCGWVFVNLERGDSSDCVADLHGRLKRRNLVLAMSAVGMMLPCGPLGFPLFLHLFQQGAWVALTLAALACAYFLAGLGLVFFRLALKDPKRAYLSRADQNS